MADIMVLPDMEIFLCERCGKNPKFMYQKKGEYKMSKICCSCAVDAFDILISRIEEDENE